MLDGWGWAEGAVHLCVYVYACLFFVLLLKKQLTQHCLIWHILKFSVQTQTSHLFFVMFLFNKIIGDRGWFSLCYSDEHQLGIQPQTSFCKRKPALKLPAALFQGGSKGLKPLSSIKPLLLS